MLHIIHGEDHVKSREELVGLRKKYEARETITIDGKKADELTYEQSFVSDSLFGDERCIIVENALTQLNKRGVDKDLVERFIGRFLESNHVVILWESRELTPAMLKKFPKTVDIATFKPNKHLFSFIESIGPGKSSLVLSQFAKVIEQEAVELVLYLLIRQFRNLLLADSGDLAKVSTLAPWQQSRVKSQARQFNSDQLLSSYRNLQRIDMQAKSGKLPLSLVEELEGFLISL